MQAWDMLLWVVAAMEVLTVCLVLIAGVAVVGRINRWRQSTQQGRVTALYACLSERNRWHLKRRQAPRVAVLRKLVDECLAMTDD